ncbi:MAG: DUF3426 domain-containing protein [Alphaproteobacteria bacterium]|nr:DUF3426 domain-containing protein [Alphaproteobacteria bacterium]
MDWIATDMDQQAAQAYGWSATAFNTPSAMRARIGKALALLGYSPDIVAGAMRDWERSIATTWLAFQRQLAQPTTPDKTAPLSVLMLENVKLEASPDGGGGIVASGEIVNISASIVTPGHIRFIFKDQNRQPIGERVFFLNPDRIAPLDRIPFRQRIADPPAGAVDVDISVAPAR